MGATIKSEEVFLAKKNVLDHDFPYEHPLVTVGDEIEPRVEVYELHNPMVNLGLRKAFYCNGEFIDVLTSPAGRRELKVSIEKKGVRKLKGKVLDLVTPGANLYSHWLLDLIPKIHAVKSAGHNLDDFDHIYVNYYNSSFKYESFRTLGIPEEKVIDFSSFPKTFEADCVVTVTPCRSSLYTPDWVENYIRSIFLHDNKNNGERKKLYISRSKGNSRRILNEAALLEKLIPLNFEVVYFEDLSLSETAHLMSSSSVIVAPHGAGLANLVFCEEKVSICEIFSQHISSEYYKFSKKKGFNYHPLQGLSSSGSLVDCKKMDYKNHRPEIHSDNIILTREMIDDIMRFVNESI
ncbi:glycosyltransferase family 61 protein [Halomonas cupida]|uniref:glycosyltransferase family 61 protein n=1 Tax=Halomonas cupida TaxID=44933 RepID=UPI003A937027